MSSRFDTILTPASRFVAVERLTRRFGSITAVDDVSFDVDRPEVFALLGPNGSGKSTLLRMMCGYLVPNSGRVLIAGADPQVDTAAKRHLGYVPDEVRFYPRMRVKSLLEMLARLKRVPRGELAARIVEVGGELGLERVLDTEIRELSRGYRQRLAIAQALIADPAVVLMDEPTNGLDPRQIREWRKIVRGIAERRAVVFTSHALAEVAAVADRVAIVTAGRLRAIEALRTNRARYRLCIADPAAAAGNVIARFARICGPPVPAADRVEFVVETFDGCDSAMLVGALTQAGVQVFTVGPESFDLEQRFFDAVGDVVDD